MSIGMGLGWKKIIWGGTLVGYWCDIDISSEYCISSDNGIGVPLIIAEEVSREEVFAGVFNFFPPIEQRF